ncbi:MAG: tetratricopeptide repeat protein, partial [Candidatus Omnitrophota bacterium]
MNDREKKYILDNIDKRPIGQIANELNIRERKIKKFLERQKEKGQAPATIEPNREPADRKIVFLSILLLVVLGFALYLNSTGGQFVWDDAYLVKNNIYIKSWGHIANIFTKDIAAGAQTQSNFYRPIQMLTYMFDHSIWGLNVRGYHLTNIFLHVLAGACVYWFTALLFTNPRLSLFSSVLFVVHPVMTEAVCYISGRADLLAGVFMLLSIICYIKSLRSKKSMPYIIALVSYAAALLSRESPLMLPVLLLVYHYAFKKKLDLKRFLPMVGIAALYVVLRFTHLKALLPHTIVDTTIFQRAPGFFVAFTEYLRLLILPIGLHMEYGNGLFSIFHPKAIFGLFAFAGILAYSFKKRNSPVIFFSITWFILTLLPQSNLYPINAYMAEHWLYMPSIGFFILLASGLERVYIKERSRRLAVAGAVSLTLFFSCLTVMQNATWKDPIAFYERTLRYAPESFRAHNSLGIKYDEMGDKERAIVSYKKAIERNPYFIYPYHNLATAYASMGNTEEAIKWYEKAIQISPSFGGTYFNLGNLYGRIGKSDEAIRAYKEALKRYPEYVEAYFNLGNAYKAAARYEEAIDAYTEAVMLDPKDTGTYNNLGNTYNAMGRPKEAIDSYKRAIEIDPNVPDAYNNLGALYSYIGQEDDAISMFNKAIEKDPTHALTYNNLAVIYLDRGEFGKAIGYCDKAVSLGS